MKHTGTIVLAICDTDNIWADCPWDSKLFPHGFEYCISKISVQRLEDLEPEFAEDNGFIHCGKTDECTTVRVRIDDVSMFDAEKLKQLNYDSELQEIEVPFDKCYEILEVDYFKLIDLIGHTYAKEVEDAFMVQVIARQYGTIKMFMDGDAYKEKITKIPGKEVPVGLLSKGNKYDYDCEIHRPVEREAS